jgi:hypothetical protein
METIEKVCTKCGEAKAVTEFRQEKRNSDGYMGSCRSCVNTANYEWIKNNPEKFRATQNRYKAKYQAKHNHDPQYREKVNQRSAKYRASEKGKETEKKYRANYYAKNKLAIREKNHKWWSENYTAKMPAYSATYYKKNAARLCEKSNEYYRDNSDARRSYAKRRIKELCASYVARTLCHSINLKPSQVPQDLIQAKRTHLKIVRKLKEEKA